jgi:AcrR family transcriptional regulator
MIMPTDRAHTGRRRNEAAREAILGAAEEVLGGSADTEVTIDTIAARAGVGRQTIYRWWPSKSAVLLDAMVQRAERLAPPADTGTLTGDLTVFLTATFRAAAAEPEISLLRTGMAEAQRDRQAAEIMREFIRRRRDVLRDLLIRGRDRGELNDEADLDLIIDQAYGLLWYRVLVGHLPLTDQLAQDLAKYLVAQGDVN